MKKKSQWLSYIKVICCKPKCSNFGYSKGGYHTQSTLKFHSNRSAHAAVSKFGQITIKDGIVQHIDF